MDARRVLVTGAGGFVASHLIPRLAQRGDTVIATGMEPVLGTHRTFLAEEYLADLRDAAAARRAVAEAAPDVVVHLAAQSSAARSFEDPVDTFLANTIGTWNLMLAIRDVAPQARVLCVGTGEVYGPQQPGTRVTEDAPIRPVSPYALSKAAADAAAQAAGSTWGLDVVRTRSFAHTGPGQTRTFVVPGWAEQIVSIERGASPPVLRVGNLAVTRDLSDVRDVADGYVALLDRGRAGAVYNVCRGTGILLSEIAQSLCAMARVPVRIEADAKRMRPSDVPYLVGDPSAAARDCGWRVTRPIEHTLADVLETLRNTVNAS
jgi:GDP-4-dehydro-6-deoxy-D-mannose reductase